jgi:hypothetical protein
MHPRVLSLLLLLLALPAIVEAKGRAVGPGARDCFYGVIDRPEWANEIALDETDVYYFDDFASTLNRVPKNGGARTELAYLPTFLVLDLIVDDTNVYLATIPFEEFDETFLPGSIIAIPKTGGVYTTLASGTPFPNQLVADASHVYWVAVGTLDLVKGTIDSDGAVERVRKDGTGRQSLATNLSAPTSLAVDTDRVYFSEIGIAEGNPSKGVRQVPKSGGPVVHVQDQYAAGDLLISGSDIVYFSGFEELGPVGFLRVARTGGPSVWIVQDDNIGGPPKIFDGRLYYAAVSDFEDTALMRVPVSGGTAELRALTHMTDYEFEVDVCGVYYGTYDETLVRSPR